MWPEKRDDGDLAELVDGKEKDKAGQAVYAQNY